MAAMEGVDTSIMRSAISARLSRVMLLAEGAKTIRTNIAGETLQK